VSNTVLSIDVPQAGGACVSTTVCRLTGQPCEAATRFISDFLNSIKVVEPFVSPEFEICGTGWLEGCTSGCMSRYRATSACVRIFCGVDADTETALLDDLADATFGDDEAAVRRLRDRSTRKLRWPSLIAQGRATRTQGADAVAIHWPAAQVPI
jgi:hypothetical protein